MREHGLGLAQAFRTMTIIPARGRDARSVSSQLYFYPVVGLVLGFSIAAAFWILLGDSHPTTLEALSMGGLWTAYMAFMTRGFHLDGLGDMADGFGGGWTRERRLEIMKDSRMGSFGAIAISMTLILKTVSCALAINARAYSLLALAPVVSRAMVVLMCSTCSYAKETGLSFDLVNGAKARHSLTAFALAALIHVPAICLSAVGFGLPITPISAIAPFLAALSATAVVGILSNARIGGVTGDILGACCEVSETAFLLLCGFVA